MDGKDFAIDSEKRLELGLVISIFFPAFLTTLQLSANSIIPWNALVGFYIYDYVIFEVIKDTVSQRLSKWLSRALLLQIALFIQPIILPSTELNKRVDWFDLTLFKFSLWALPVASLIVLIIISIGLGQWTIVTAPRAKSRVISWFKKRFTKTGEPPKLPQDGGADKK